MSVVLVAPAVELEPEPALADMRASLPQSLMSVPQPGPGPVPSPEPPIPQPEPYPPVPDPPAPEPVPPIPEPPLPVGAIPRAMDRRWSTNSDEVVFFS
ncbi:MAG: hypothetical protein M3378_03660 [Actinomycetota bacterium]|nr:hypothetical protein [Actinomycetota bacterium]